MAIMVPYLQEGSFRICRRGKLKRKTIGAMRLVGRTITTATAGEQNENPPMGTAPVRNEFTNQYGTL